MPARSAASAGAYVVSRPARRPQRTNGASTSPLSPPKRARSYGEPPQPSPAMPPEDELRRERAYLDAAYDRVLAMRASAKALRATARLLTETRSGQALCERDSAIAHTSHRLAALEIAKDRLLVGRLDLD